MKLIIIFSFLFVTFQAFGQNYILPDGEYMDTTAYKDSVCKDYNLYYYQVGGKYLKSSSTILNELREFLLLKNKIYKGSGYVTFRFKIDCLGNKMKKIQVIQTDEKYKSNHFDKEFVSELYKFLNTLTDWRIAKDPNGKVYPYNAFITYKIKDGKVINIIP